MAARTDAARTEVVAARSELGVEFDQLGGATREAVDIPAKIRRAPLKSAASRAAWRSSSSVARGA